MIIDNKGKLFGKINIVDIIVVLILIIAVCVTYFKFNMSAHSDVSETNAYVEFDVKVEDVRDFSVNSLKEGDVIYDSQNDVCLGKVISTRTEPAGEYITKDDGTIVFAQMPERYDLYITIGSEARINDSGIYVDGTKPVIKHQTIDMESQRNKMTGNVVSVNVK